VSYKLKYKKVLSLSPCLPLVLKGWDELLKLGYVDSHCTTVINDNYEVIYFECNNEPVAFLLFSTHPEEGYVWIRLVYVRPDHRRNHLYQKMYKKLKNMCIKEGVIPRISGGINTKNKTMITTAKKMGRYIEYSVWTEDLIMKE
jgi:GNAT superfamily N-acetyltransferase